MNARQTLFPPADDRSRWDGALAEQLTRAEARVRQGAVTPRIDLDRFRRDLAGFDFAAPRVLEELLSWVIATMEAGLVHITSPRYFGLFNPAPSFPAQCADRIVASFNPQLATWTTSPAAVEIEAHVIRAVAARVGLATGTGHFTTGGAEANFTALICALTRAQPGFAQHGARSFAGPPTLYISREAHLAWVKIAHQAGLGRAAVRLVETDGSGRMDPKALAATLRDDSAQGRVPAMIVATAGTTGAGMIDPIDACADIAGTNGLWFHVDAAWGGALIASGRLRDSLPGIGGADSVTIDAHKWFAATMGCGMFLTRHAEALAAAFHVSASYMPSNVVDRDPYVTSVQWSRRFLGLRLFLALGAVGWAGFAAHVEHSIALAAELKDRLLSQGWRVVNDSPVAVICAEPPPGADPVRAIVARVLGSGRAWVSVSVFEGREVLRACVTHGESTSRDVDELLIALRESLRG